MRSASTGRNRKWLNGARLSGEVRYSVSLCGPYLPDVGASRLGSSFIASCVYTSHWTLNSVTDTSNRRPDNKQYINASAAAAVIGATTSADQARRHDRTDRHVCSVRGKLKYSQSVGWIVNQSSSLHERRFDHCNGSTAWLRARRSASLHNAQNTHH